TLRGGRARDGGAIMSSGDLTLSCSVFSDNEADYEGGAVSSAGALEVRGCSFHDNYADYGGGAISARGVTTIVDSELHENEAGYEGGAVVASSGLRITRAAFVGNFADYSGGAVEFGSRVDETLALEDTLFRDNEAGYEGGAVGFGSWASDRLIARRTWFVGNMAGSGAAIELGSWGAAALVMEDCEVRDNEATGGSAAIDFGGWLRQGGSARLARTTFTNNTARSGASVLATNSRAAPVDVTAFAIRVLRNVGTDAAFALEATDPMRCRRCDFGQGANDNAPADVRHGGSVSGQAPMNFTL
ncbi:MAG TPA: hypothetical protein PKA64_18990, partial [Myxococcota bacterium]|nr:hypothetical protein [Myxococcota bacterium]